MTALESEKKLFGTDGVRGHANQFPMTVENALALGRAAGIVFRRHSGKHKVVIGKDTRLSCYMYENALIAGLCSMGVDTLMVGPLPTPGIAFLIRAYRADAGFVISASHNAFHDNGIKIFGSDGFKLPSDLEKEIESLVFDNHFNDQLPHDEQIGRNARIIDADGRYIEHVKSTLPKRMSLRGMNIVLDCANGAGHRVAPMIFRELDANVHSYSTQPNGLNINLNCGSLHPEVIQKGVLEHQANVGIALDGDGDRVIMVDEKAQVVDGDALLAICAKDLKRRGELVNNQVVSTVMSNFGFKEAMQREGIEILEVPVGDRHVIAKMRESGARLGGEQSGHLMFLDYNTTADGLVSALQVLRIMIETGSTLSELASFVKLYPQELINVPVKKRVPLEELKGLQKAKAEVEKQLADKGRVLLRYSGTERICRVMVEAPEPKLAKTLAEKLVSSLKEEMEALTV